MDLVNLYPYLIIFLSASMPISEIRGALPLGLLIYKLPLLQVFLISFLGNFLGVLLFFIFLKYFSAILAKRIKFINHLLNWIFARTHKKFYNKHQAWGDLALLLFVALPLPITGGWTGAVAAFLFNLPSKKSLFLIGAGILIAGFIVSLITLTANDYLKLLSS